MRKFYFLVFLLFTAVLAQERENETVSEEIGGVEIGEEVAAQEVAAVAPPGEVALPAEVAPEEVASPEESAQPEEVTSPAEVAPPAEAATPPEVTPAEAVPEQPKWPDALEISEETPKLVTVPWSKEFENILKEADQINRQIEEIINRLRESRKWLDQKYLEFDKRLDEFLQDIGFLYGQVEEYKEKEEKNTVSLQATNALKAKEETVAPSSVAVKPTAAEVIGRDYATEWEKVKAKIDEIDNEEDEILKKIGELDEQIDNAIDEAFEAHKISVDLLSAKDQQAAQQSLEKLKASLKKVKELEDTLQKTKIKKIDDALGNLESKMKQVEGTVEDLKSKRQELFVIEKEEEEEIEKKEVLEEEVPESKWFQKTVHVVAVFIHFLKRAGRWLLEACGRMGKWLEQVIKREKDGEQEVSASAPPPPIPPSEQSDQAGSKTQDPVLQGIKSQIKSLEANIRNLEEEKKRITKKRQELEMLKRERVEQIKEKLKLMEKAWLEGSAEKEVKEAVEKPKWRAVVENLFGKFLDLIPVVAQKIKAYSVWFYEKVFKGKLTKFVAAVKKRSEEIEKNQKKGEVVIEEIPPEQLSQPPEIAKEEAEKVSPQSEEGIGVPADMGPVSKDMIGSPPTLPENEEAFE